MASMRMGLEMKMSQQLIMTPQLQQAIKLLQLSRVEMEELIDQALVENPALEVEPVEKEENASEETEESKDEASNLVEEQSQLSYDDEWQDYIESGAGIIQEVRNHHSDSGDSNPLEATVSNSTSLMDHLFWQLDTSSLEDLEREIAEYLIGNIDEDGYLSITLRELIATTPKLLELVLRAQETGVIPVTMDEIATSRFDCKHEVQAKIETRGKKKKAAPIQEEEEGSEGVEAVNLNAISDEDCGILESVLRKLQFFDPPGVFSRTLQECLENQLVILKMESSLAFSIVHKHMQFLEQKDLKKVARLQKADIQEVVKAYELITELEPKPGRPFGKDVTQYVIPDVFIHKRGTEYVVTMNQESMPRLRINPHYQHIANNTKLDKAQEKSTRNDADSDMTYLYLQEKIKAGEWLMKSIEQRQKTIYRVTKSLLKYQYEFFEKGLDYLKPLVLKDVADDIDVHESTVSRITTNKYVYTPQGIFELKYFFTSGIDQGDGDIISSKKIKDYIRKLVDTEDKKKPYTDLQIKDHLEKNAGIKVARRTVAKYREAMNILPSNKRKQLY